MGSVSRLLLIGLCSTFWVWGQFFATVQQQEALQRAAASSARAIPAALASLGRLSEGLLRQLLE